MTVRKKADLTIVRAFGADEIINVQEENVEQYKSKLTQDRSFDFIFDTFGGATLDQSFIAAALMARLLPLPHGLPMI